MASQPHSQMRFRNSMSMVSPQQLLLTFVHAEDRLPTSSSVLQTPSNSNTTNEEKKRRTRVVWGARETNVLLEIWGPKYSQIKGASIAVKREIWENIYLEFESACRRQTLTITAMSVDQLKKRIANLEYKYRQLIARMASAEEKDTLKLKTDFPFFDAIHEVLGVRDVANSEFRIHVESTSVTPPESRATSSAQEDLKVGVVAELSVSGSSNGETDKSTVSGHVNDQETNQASAKVLGRANVDKNGGKALKRKRQLLADDAAAEPYTKQLCEMWKVSLEKQEEWFNRIIEIQEEAIRNQTAQTRMLVDGLRDIIRELINGTAN